MAAADYRLCDVCGGKAFYDSELGYEINTEGSPYNKTHFKIAGEDQCSNPELLERYGYTLQYLGDWAVICNECSKEYKTQIVKIEKVNNENQPN